MARRNGMAMTGQQPGIGGAMTGADKGVCASTTGTPYVGADQAAQACPAQAAEPGSPDFPQMLNAAGATPWGDFSVEAPNHASDTLGAGSRVTGAEAGQSSITGPFGMASGKVTGTEEARFSVPAPQTAPETAPEIAGRVKSRISGEGMDAGARITGDDWDRGDRVTGTEGLSAKGRNPSRRGSVGTVMPAAGMRRSEDVPEPVSPVTGSSGNTASGSLITYSGGARG
ncbi:MAG: CsoS2 family carboxysome shell protein, partial [Gammaproteobacteria bacterium]